MNDLKVQRDEMFMDKNVTACDLPEIVVCNYKALTYNVVKDICVDEGVALMHEKLLLDEKDSVKVNTNPLESKSSEDIQDYSKLNQENLIVSEEVNDDSEVGCEKSLPSNVVATLGSVSNEALTLRDIISMEDSQKPKNNSNINGHETEEQETETAEAENKRLNYVFKDNHNLVSSKFANGFGERSFSEEESGLAHITYSGHISVSGSLSVRSDGSTVSAHSFAFPILQSEWNSSPVRMVKAVKRQPRKKKGWRHYSLLLCCRF